MISTFLFKIPTIKASHSTARNIKSQNELPSLQTSNAHQREKKRRHKKKGETGRQQGIREFSAFIPSSEASHRGSIAAAARGFNEQRTRSIRRIDHHFFFFLQNIQAQVDANWRFVKSYARARASTFFFTRSLFAYYARAARIIRYARAHLAVRACI